MCEHNTNIYAQNIGLSTLDLDNVVSLFINLNVFPYSFSLTTQLSKYVMLSKLNEIQTSSSKNAIVCAKCS